MPNEITRFKAQAPVEQSREIASLEAVYSSRLEHHPGGIISISDQFMPTPGDRQALENRRGDIVDSLKIGKPASLAIEVAEMFRAFPSVRMADDLARKTLAAYVAQINHLPLWAVERGCRACAARDIAFPPSAGELRAACERVVQPVRDEEAKLRKILNADVYHQQSEAERERVKAGFREILAALG